MLSLILFSWMVFLQNYFLKVVFHIYFLMREVIPLYSWNRLKIFQAVTRRQ